MSNTEAFKQLLEQLKPLRLTADQWADLNYAVTLDEDSEKWVSKSPEDIGDELQIQARRVAECLREIEPVELPYMGNTLSQLEALGTKGIVV